MTGSPDQLWHEAVHVAGSAVIGRVLGLSFGCDNPFHPVHPFILDALQDSDWRSSHDPEKSGHERAIWRNMIIASMAGGEAERLIIGLRAGEEYHCGRCSPNDGHLGYPGGRPEEAARMRRFARQLVKKHRAAIHRFAEQLVAADELDALLAGERHAA